MSCQPNGAPDISNGLWLLKHSLWSNANESDTSGVTLLLVLTYYRCFPSESIKMLLVITFLSLIWSSLLIYCRNQLIFCPIVWLKDDKNTIFFWIKCLLLYVCPIVSKKGRECLKIVAKRIDNQLLFVSTLFRWIAVPLFLCCDWLRVLMGSAFN